MIWKRRRGKKCFLLRFPLWLQVIIAAWLSFSAVFGVYLANSASLQHSDTVSNRRYDKIGLPETVSMHQYNKRQSRTARRNLIIIAHGRSGSSFTGDIFNHHPDVFYMYEPLQTVERTRKDFKLDYNSLAQKFLSNVLQCDFSEPIFLADIERYYRKPAHPQISQAIASPPLCPYNISDARWDFRQCPKMSSETLGNACKNYYKLTVIKVLMKRIPYNSLEKTLSACDSQDINCKVVLLIRDPRAVIPSSLSVSFYKEEGGNAKLGTRMFSYKLCKQTEESLNSVKNLPAWMRSQIKVLRYEDLAKNPLEEMKRLYKFAGLSVLESVTTWLNESTHPTKSRSNMKIQGSQAAFTVDDAQAAINRWRWKVHPYEITIIEHYCRHVMQLMGYRPVDRSHELQANISIPLVNGDYEAKNWLRD
ncbi:carbohydrate sulfotransferase 4-like [Oculina patagonica]